MPEHYSRPARDSRECKYWWFDAWDWLVNSVLRTAGTPTIMAAPGEVAIDPHLHTLFSHCSISQPQRVILKAAKLGLGGIGIMDHHVVKGALDAMRCAEDLKRRGLLAEEFLVIPGVELNSNIGHVGALFVTEDLPEKLDPVETVRIIHEAGGLAVAVHPYHSTGIGDAVFDAPFDAVEVECGAVFEARMVARNNALASDPRLAGVAKLGSSDGHYTNAIAGCYTVLTVETPTLESVKQAMAEGRSEARTSAPSRRIRRMLGGVRKLR